MTRRGVAVSLSCLGALLGVLAMRQWLSPAASALVVPRGRRTAASSLVKQGPLPDVVAVSGRATEPHWIVLGSVGDGNARDIAVAAGELTDARVVFQCVFTASCQMGQRDDQPAENDVEICALVGYEGDVIKPCAGYGGKRFVLLRLLQKDSEIRLPNLMKTCREEACRWSEWMVSESPSGDSP